jgi:hypothetical protein
MSDPETTANTPTTTEEPLGSQDRLDALYRGAWQQWTREHNAKMEIKRLTKELGAAQSDQPQTTDPHPYYGPCDSLLPDGGCAECEAQRVGYRGPGRLNTVAAIADSHTERKP